MTSTAYYISEDRMICIVCGRGISKKFPVHRHKSISLGMIVQGYRTMTLLRHWKNDKNPVVVSRVNSFRNFQCGKILEFHPSSARSAIGYALAEYMH